MQDKKENPEAHETSFSLTGLPKGFSNLIISFPFTYFIARFPSFKILILSGFYPYSVLSALSRAY